MNKIILVCLFALVILPFVSSSDNLAEMSPIKVGDCMPLVQYCSNCTYVNITSISYPNGTISALNYVTVKTGSDTYVYNSFCDTNQIGTYTYGTLGNPDGQITSQPVSREVTKTGQILTTSKTALYIFTFIVGLLLMILFLILGIKLPSKNDTDAMTGYIIAVSNMKYLKIFFLGLAYLCFVGTAYIVYSLAYLFLEVVFLSNLAYFVFITSAYLIIPLFIVGVYLIIANWIRDNKIADALQRGFRIK